jgi:ketosteroid isomerase-like protein
MAAGFLPGDRGERAVIIDAGPTVVVERLARAINAHDLGAVVDCFHADVHSEQPTRPDRGFRGREELRGYWEQVIDGAGDFEAKLLRCAGEGDTAWAEWCWYGTRGDGTRFARAGVTIYGVRDDRIAWIRVYMEPVAGDATTVAGWMMQELTRGARR